MRLRRAAAAGLLLLLAACGPKHYRFPPAYVPPVGEVKTGIASWYGPGYHGKRTSSGERYAFGTRVRVTLLSTGRSVEVRINDRFPNRRRVIDVSRAAARAVGLIGPGTGKVRVEVVAAGAS